jgi:hypothetical protein
VDIRVFDQAALKAAAHLGMNESVQPLTLTWICEDDLPKRCAVNVVLLKAHVGMTLQHNLCGCSSWFEELPGEMVSIEHQQATGFKQPANAAFTAGDASSQADATLHGAGRG